MPGSFLGLFLSIRNQVYHVFPSVRVCSVKENGATNFIDSADQRNLPVLSLAEESWRSILADLHDIKHGGMVDQHSTMALIGRFPIWAQVFFVTDLRFQMLRPDDACAKTRDPTSV